MLIVATVLFPIIFQADQPADTTTSRDERKQGANKTRPNPQPNRAQKNAPSEKPPEVGSKIPGKRSSETPVVSPREAGKLVSTPLRIELVKEGEPWWKGVLPHLIAFGGILVAALTLWFNRLHNERTLRQKANEDEIREIQTKLDSFYGPFLQLLKTSENLYRLFSHDKPPEFRTLTQLIEGMVFTGNDAVLLQQIIDVTQQLDRLLVEQSGLIDSELQPLISQASTHFRLILLASQGKLSGETNRFSSDVYPRELNLSIAQEIARLKSRQQTLRSLE